MSASPSVATPYELLTLLARGGMAELHLARRVGLGGFSRLLAVKRILPHLSEDPQFAQMFLDEGRIAARLTHPNICQVFDLGEADGRLFLAMEYLEGVAWDLFASVLPHDAGGAYLRLLAGAITQFAAGLSYAHELRDPHSGALTPVVHRDVSPQNLFVTTAGICKVLDFGVAKVLTEGKRTRSGVVKGKLAYMAPEQIRGQAVDARTDVFALATVLWEAITGVRLFERSTDFLVWQAINEEPIPPPSQLRPEVPAALDRAILRGLARDPAHRPATITEFADEVRDATAWLGPSADPSELGAAVRELCVVPLAAQAAKVNAAQRHGATTPGPAPTHASEDGGARHGRAGSTLLDLPGEASGAGELSASVGLRARPVAVGRDTRSPRRWLGWGAAALLIGSLGLAAALVLRPGGGAPASEPTMPGAGLLPAGTDAGAVAASAAAAVDAASAPAPAWPVDAGTVAAAAPRDAGSSGRVGGRGPVSAAEEGTGFLTIDSNPYATIFVDGRRLGDTPLFRAEVPAGRRRVRAVRADQRSKTFTITIAKDKEHAHGAIAW
ncbi:MAG: serine/threonine protein kinase [Kofleriaceae bacterium]|nr:serine/threonine protein kinase [Kofleriaceae bacterium]